MFDKIRKIWEDFNNGSDYHQSRTLDSPIINNVQILPETPLSPPIKPKFENFQVQKGPINPNNINSFLSMEETKEMDHMEEEARRQAFNQSMQKYEQDLEAFNQQQADLKNQVYSNQQPTGNQIYTPQQAADLEQIIQNEMKRMQDFNDKMDNDMNKFHNNFNMGNLFKDFEKTFGQGSNVRFSSETTSRMRLPDGKIETKTTTSNGKDKQTIICIYDPKTNQEYCRKE